LLVIGNTIVFMETNVIVNIIKHIRKSMHLRLKNRKLVAVGYSVTVTLPKVWLENAGLSVGDFVSQEISDDGYLILKPVAEEKGGLSSEEETHAH